MTFVNLRFVRKRAALLCCALPLLAACNTMLDGTEELMGYAGKTGRFLGRKVLEGMAIAGETMGSGSSESVDNPTSNASDAKRLKNEGEYDYGGGYYDNMKPASGGGYD